MIWVWLVILGTLSGFAVHQLVKNYLANKIVRAMSPLRMSKAVEALTILVNSYVKLIDDANRITGVCTNAINFAVSCNLIYSVGVTRSIITSLSSFYLVPGHAEYQVHGLRYWLSDIYPQLKILATYSNDVANVKELRSEANSTVIDTWQRISSNALQLLESVAEMLRAGVGE